MPPHIHCGHGEAAGKCPLVRRTEDMNRKTKFEMVLKVSFGKFCENEDARIEHPVGMTSARRPQPMIQSQHLPLLSSVCGFTSISGSFKCSLCSNSLANRTMSFKPA